VDGDQVEAKICRLPWWLVDLFGDGEKKDSSDQRGRYSAKVEEGRRKVRVREVEVK
jgi:hypothetical protein